MVRIDFISDNQFSRKHQYKILEERAKWDITIVRRTVQVCKSVVITIKLGKGKNFTKDMFV